MPFKSPPSFQSSTASASRSTKSRVLNMTFWVKDIIVLGMILFSTFLFIIMFSYHDSDPGFAGLNQGQEAQNIGGQTGAWLASLLLYFFGIFGFLWPFGIAFATYLSLNISSGVHPRYGLLFRSFMGLVILVVAGAGLASLFLEPEHGVVVLPYSGGGVLGYEISQILVKSIDLLGATLVFLIMLAVGFSFLIGQSWLQIMEWTGWFVSGFGQAIYLKLFALFQHREGAEVKADDRPVVEPRLTSSVVDLKSDVEDVPSRLKPSNTSSESTQASKSDAVQEREVQAAKKEDDEVSSPVETEVEKDERQTELLLDLEEESSDKKEVASDTLEKASKVTKSLEIDDETSPTPRKKKLLNAVGVLSEKMKSTTQNLSGKAQVAKESSAVSTETLEEASDTTVKPVSKATSSSKTSSAKKSVTTKAAPQLPHLGLLDTPPEYEEGYSESELLNLSELLEARLKEFNVSVTVEEVQPGPVVTRFEVMPAAGVKVSQINNLAKDLARVLSVKSVRVVDIIPGKSVVGIEIPNQERDIVSFSEVMASDAFQKAKSRLTVALGKDIAGEPIVADIAKMPHLLVAGTTGSGKSVGVNAMILSLLYKATPDEVRMIMVDPKMLELSIYEDIPHLLTPVVTDMAEAANALRWCVFEMDRRYQLMAKLGVRNIAGFNAKVQGAIDAGKPLVDPLYAQAKSTGLDLGEAPPTLKPLPYIVVVVDEFADMIMVVGKEVEQLIARIAQKARAAGIHLILATQRPSVNVITGLIKANIPTRISFMVNTKIDSRTILDQGGAEQLLGMGDMLYMPPGTGAPERVHGAFMSDDEVHAVAEFVKSQGEPQYLEGILQSPEPEAEPENSSHAEQDALYDQVVAFVAEGRRVSVSLVQRQFSIGYNRAARIVEAMEAAGIVSASKSNGNREVLVGKPE